MKLHSYTGFILFCLASGSQAEQRYFVTDITGEHSSLPRYRGLANDVTCLGNTSAATSQQGDLVIREANGNYQQIPKPAGTNSSAGRMFSPTGSILGNLYRSGYQSEPFEYSPVSGFVGMGSPYPGSTMFIDLKAVNSSGKVVGEIEVPGPGVRGVRWQKVGGQWQYDVLPRVNGSYVYDINDDGLMVGGTAGGPCVWADDLTRTQLLMPTIGGTWRGVGTGFDGQGRIWGHGYVVNGNHTDYGILRWDSISSTPALTIYGGVQDTTSPLTMLQVNSHGQIAGYYVDDSQSVTVGYAVLFNPGEGLLDLNNYIGDAANDYKLGEAYQINDSGVIICSTINRHDFSIHDVLLTPVPEPTSLLLLTPGLAWVVMRRRRRKADNKADQS